MKITLSSICKTFLETVFWFSMGGAVALGFHWAFFEGAIDVPPIPPKAYTCVPPNHPGMEGISFWDKGNLVCIIKERDVTMVPCLKSHRPEKHAKNPNA